MRCLTFVDGPLKKGSEVNPGFQNVKLLLCRFCVQSDSLVLQTHWQHECQSSLPSFWPHVYLWLCLGLFYPEEEVLLSKLVTNGQVLYIKRKKKIRVTWSKNEDVPLWLKSAALINRSVLYHWAESHVFLLHQPELRNMDTIQKRSWDRPKSCFLFL